MIFYTYQYSNLNLNNLKILKSLFIPYINHRRVELFINLSIIKKYTAKNYSYNYSNHLIISKKYRNPYLLNTLREKVFYPYNYFNYLIK